MPKFFFSLMSKLDRTDELFEDSFKKLSAVNPKEWPKEKMLFALDAMKYDCFICNHGPKMVGAVVFNPDRFESSAKAFLIFVCEEFRGQGIAALMVAEFIKWAFANKFKRAQIGLGNSVAAIAVLRSLKKEMREFNLGFADINPETGHITWLSEKS